MKNKPKSDSKSEALLKKIARIQQMERGKLCPMQSGAYYNHQTWENGKNVVRYVPRDRVANLKKAIAGYQLFLKLSQAYADQIILHTRLDTAPKPSPHPVKIKKYAKT